MMNATTDLARRVFEGFHDVEVVVVAGLLADGVVYRSGFLEAGLAAQFTNLANDLVAVELRRREVTTTAIGPRLFQRLLDRMLAEQADDAAAG